MAESDSKYVVKYHGFVYLDVPSGVPSPAAVDKACKLLKSNKKTAREMHPLFARGLDTQLDLTISVEGLTVTLPGSAFSPIVMNHPIHKIAFVCDHGTGVCFIVKRPGDKGKFKCHFFDAGSTKVAVQVAQHAARVCNEVFFKLRRVSKRVKGRTQSLAAAAKAALAAAPPTPAAPEVEEVVVASQVAEADASEIEKAVKEVESDAPAAEPVSASTKVEFLDGIGDKLADLSIGRKKQLVLPEESLDLDSDVFSVGVVSGDAEC